MTRFILILFSLLLFPNFLASQESFVEDGFSEVIYHALFKEHSSNILFEIRRINKYNRAQKKVKVEAQKLDSIISYNSENDEKQYRTKFLYDKLGRNTSRTRSRISRANDSLISLSIIYNYNYDSNNYCVEILAKLMPPNRHNPMAIMNYTFNNEGLLISRTTRIYNVDKSKWENSSKITANYTESEHIYQATKYLWKDSVWIPQGRYEFSYEMGNVILKTFHTYRGKWEKIYARRTSYNSSNQISSTISFNPTDSLTYSDTNYHKKLYFYNIKRLLARKIILNTNGLIKIDESERYIYDSKGNCITKTEEVRYSEKEGWLPMGGTEFIYDSLNNNIEEIEYLMNTLDGSIEKKLIGKTVFIVDYRFKSDSTLFPFLFNGPKLYPYLLKKNYYSWEQEGDRNMPYIDRYFYSSFSSKP